MKEMKNTRSGLSAADPGTGTWSKPWSSPSGGSCLEARKLSSGAVALRQSTDPAGPVLVLQAREIRAFIEGAKAGLSASLLREGPRC
jgi:Domain of unknown function (DUF397)